MNDEAEDLELIVGEEYRYNGHIYAIASVLRGFVELHSTTQPSNMRLQTLDRLEQAAKHHRFVKVREAPFSGRYHQIVAALNQDSRAALDRRTAYVRAAIERFKTRLPREGCETLIAEVKDIIGDASPPCFNTLRNWVHRYLERNESVTALIPLKKLHQDQWERLPEITRETIEDCLAKYYYIEDPESVSDIIGAIQSGIEKYNALRPLTDQIIVPSPSTLRRRIKESGEFRRLLKQKGAQEAIKASRWSVKLRRQYRLLQRIEGDTHTLDIELVNEHGDSIGKAALTILLDVASRRVIGWDISINPPSAQKTIRALKDSLHRVGVGEEYRLDNGSENTKKDALDGLFPLLGPNIIYCRVRRPNEKPYVERWFKTLTTGLTHRLRGTTFSNPNERGDYPSEKKAIYTLEVIKERFADWLENVYHKRRHRGIGTSPNKIWAKLVNNQPPLRLISSEDMSRLFLSQTSSKLVEGRVRFKNLQWSCGELKNLQDLGTKEQLLTIFYDACDLGQVLVTHPNYPDKVFHAKGCEMSYQDGLTLDLHLLLNAIQKKEAKNFDFRDAREHRTRMMQERYDYEHKRGRRKAAQTDEKIGQARPQENMTRTAPPDGTHLPTTDVEKYFGMYPAPTVGDISEVMKND
ncbi:MAG: transposase family protein [Pseudomonadales bacterium]|jgi:putative transposase|nr:transposase family protein [Pseudomonadales bacterium]MBH2074428.1 transposase family protein [Pseudomonadales bacterium]